MTLQVTPPNTSPGQTVSVTVLGSSRTGQTVKVDVDDGGVQGDTVRVNLNESGNGTAAWTVPNWEVANFNYGSCAQVTILIGGDLAAEGEA